MHGHFNAKCDHAEFYIAVCVNGALLLMFEDSATWSQVMKAGSIRYIPGCIAYCIVNKCGEDRVLLARCPSDSGHYCTPISDVGFGRRIMMRDEASCQA